MIWIFSVSEWAMLGFHHHAAKKIQKFKGETRDYANSSLDAASYEDDPSTCEEMTPTPVMISDDDPNSEST